MFRCEEGNENDQKRKRANARGFHSQISHPTAGLAQDLFLGPLPLKFRDATRKIIKLSQ